MLRALLLVIVISMVTACMPMRTAYYKPIGPGNYYKGPCGGPNDLLGFEVTNGLGLMISTRSTSTDNLGEIHLRFFVGPGHSLKLMSPTFQFLEKTTRKTQTISIANLIYYEWQTNHVPYVRQAKTFSATEELIGDLQQPGLRSVMYSEFQNYRPYEATIHVDSLPATQLSLEFPKALFDGKPIDFPVIQIEYRNEFFLSGIC